MPGIDCESISPAGNLFWGNSQGISFYNNMYSGTLTSNTPYSASTGTAKGPPADAYCYPLSATCDMLSAANLAGLANKDPQLTFSRCAVCVMVGKPKSPIQAMCNPTLSPPAAEQVRGVYYG